jgi:hypothetical protein
VQRLVDRSVWKPIPEIARIRQIKAIKLGGQSLTDIDAIGASNGTLLLISCKSVALPSSYFEGEYNVVRNRRTQLEQDVDIWSRRVQSIRISRIGDNFDFTQFDNIVGVVITPSPVYVEAPAAMNDVLPGLPATCSYSEFADWLNVRRE